MTICFNIHNNRFSSLLFGGPTSSCFMCEDNNNNNGYKPLFLPSSIFLSSSPSSASTFSASSTKDDEFSNNNSNNNNNTSSSAIVFGNKVDDGSNQKMGDDDSVPHEDRIVNNINKKKEAQHQLKSPTTIKKQTSTSSTKAKLRQISNVASLLCLLDCTLLPIITFALPFIGFFVDNMDNDGDDGHHQPHSCTSTTIQMEYWSHQIALYFVLPMGFLTGVLNCYLYPTSNNKLSVTTMMTAIGLVLIGLANSHVDHLPFIGHIDFLHVFHHDGPFHRITNILGCILLLGSNTSHHHANDRAN